MTQGRSLKLFFKFQVAIKLMLPGLIKYLLRVDWDDRSICIAYSMFVYFFLAYATLGGLGIALHRLIYIKVRI